MSAWQVVLIIVGGLLVIALGLRLLLHKIAWKAWFGTKPNGTDTPADLGVPYEEHWIPVGDRRLQAWFVRAPPDGAVKRAMLLFQGGNDVISELGPLQKYLCDHHISSLVFDFAGNGKSTGRPSVETLTEDGLAAFTRFLDLVGDESRIYLWGYSSGTARLLAAVSRAGLKMDGIVLMGPFTTSRALMLHHLRFIPALLGPFLLPEYWDNLQALQRIRSPVLIVHSRADEAVPYFHGETLARVGTAPVCLSAVEGLKHNDCWSPLHEAYWQPVFEFMERGC